MGCVADDDFGVIDTAHKRADGLHDGHRRAGGAGSLTGTGTATASGHPAVALTVVLGGTGTLTGTRSGGWRDVHVLSVTARDRPFTITEHPRQFGISSRARPVAVIERPTQ